MNGTALIIDDNKLNLETLAVLLEKEGFEAITLTTPRDIFNALEQVDRVDVVFLDLEYPNDNGLVAINDLRAHPALQNVPIIAYSVHISEIHETRAAGFDGFIGKPLDVTTFPHNLQRILQGQPVWEVGQ